MPLANQLPGESDLQYNMRQGLNPNDASAALSGAMTGNGSPVQSAASRLNSYVLNRNAPNQRDFYGQNISPGGVTGNAAINLPNAGPALDASFYGGYGRNSISSASRGNISNNSGVAPTQADFGFKTPDAYGGNYFSASRGDTQQLGPVDHAANSNSLPAMNPNEDSKAYMARIGMNPADIEAAHQMSASNPNMSFQDIMARGGYKTGLASNNPRAAAAANPVSAMEQQRQAAWAAYYAKQGQQSQGDYRLNTGQLRPTTTTELPVTTPKFSSIASGGQELTSSGGPDYGGSGFIKNSWRNPQWGNQ